MTLWILFGTFALFLLMGMPVAFCLSISSLLTILYIGLPPMVAFQQLNAGFNSVSMIAIPLFIFAGDLMMRGGIADRLIQFAASLVGHLRGGMGQVNVLSSVFFSGISGSAVADASAVGGILVPQMVKRGYHADYAVNVTIASAIIALILPPSPNLIMYSIAAGGKISIIDLFTAGIVPGLLLALSLMITAYVVARKRGYPAEAFGGFRRIGIAFIHAIPALFLISIIFVGVRFGIFTPTESSCVAVLFAALVIFVTYRAEGWDRFRHAMLAATRTTAIVLLIIAAAAPFGWLMAFLQVPATVVAAMQSLSENPYVILALINIVLLILGTFMDMAPMIIICTPIFLPVVMQFGIDPVQFGIIMILNAGIGLNTPPVGSVMFVGCAIGKISIGELMKTIWPFYAASIAVLLLVTYIPAVSLWLPGLFH